MTKHKLTIGRAIIIIVLSFIIAFLIEAVINDSLQGKSLKTEQVGEVSSLLEISEFHYGDYDDSYYSEIKTFDRVLDEGRLACLDFPETKIGSVKLEFESPLSADSLVVLNWNKRPIADYSETRNDGGAVKASGNDTPQKDFFSPYKTTRMRADAGSQEYVFSMGEEVYTHLDIYVQQESVIKDVKYSPLPLSVTSRRFNWAETAAFFVGAIIVQLLLYYLLPNVSERYMLFIQKKCICLYDARKGLFKWAIITVFCGAFTALYAFCDAVANDVTCAQKSFFCFCLLMITAILWFNRKKFFENYNKIIFGLILISGLMVAGTSMYGNSGFDADVHFKRALNSSYFFSDTAVITQADAFYIDSGEKFFDNNSVHTPLFRYRISQSARELYEGQKTLDKAYHNGNYYFDVPLRGYRALAYLPSAVLLFLGRALHLPFSICYLLGRTGNLLVYAVLMTMALKRLKERRILFGVLSLLPMHMFMAGNYSYDPFLTAFVTYAFVCFAEEYRALDKQLSTRQLMIYLICIIIGISSKPVFFPLLLLPILYPATKFGSKKKRILCYLFSITSVLILFAFLMFVKDTDMEGGKDIRVSDLVDCNRQIQHVLMHPLSYIVLLFKFNVTFWGFENFTTIFGDWKTLGYLPSWICALSLLILVLSVLLDSNVARPEKMTLKQSWIFKFGILGCVLLCVVMVSTAFYCVCSPVAANSIIGVQPRYYISLMFPLTYLITNTGIMKTTKKPIYEIVLISGAVLTTVLSVNEMVIQRIFGYEFI